MGDASQDPTPENKCFLQAFEWNVPADQKHWKRLRAVLPDLKAIGVDAMWIPPACKGSGGGEANGYDIYDLYDLGEFDQKGAKSTKWGPKEDLSELVNEAQKAEVNIYFDAVLNHKAGADNKEKCRVIEVDQSDRTKEIGEEHEIEAWLNGERQVSYLDVSTAVSASPCTSLAQYKAMNCVIRASREDCSFSSLIFRKEAR
jgi:alpha-amylase